MGAHRVKMLAASVAIAGTRGFPAAGAAQQAAAVECARGQRAVVDERRVQGRTQVVTRCEGVPALAYRAGRQDRRRAAGDGRGRETERTKTKTALMIGGAAAAGAGVGGAMNGTRGALIGAAIGGGAASIYEASKRR